MRFSAFMLDVSTSFNNRKLNTFSHKMQNKALYFALFAKIDTVILHFLIFISLVKYGIIITT